VVIEYGVFGLNRDDPAGFDGEVGESAQDCLRKIKTPRLA
jgi:hypothetical protein